MPKLIPVPWKKFEKFVLHVGCAFNRQESSHRMYVKQGIPRSVVFQARGNVPVFIILNNLRTLGIHREEYLRIMSKL